MTSKSLPARSRRATAGFTMIELLTVIAIIAILAAIIFPVMGTVQESARRGTTMSNLQKIGQAVAAYELDNREYPEFLFGPAICKANGLPDTSCSDFYTMKETASLVTGRFRSIDPDYQASKNARRIFTKSLYPEYIRDLETFTSPNNAVRTSTSPLVGGVTRYTFLTSSGTTFLPQYLSKSQAGACTIASSQCQGGVLVPVVVPMYAYDVFDASPKVDVIAGTIDNSNLVARYSRLWTGVVSNAVLDTMRPTPTSSGTGLDAQTYQRQLLWAKPPSETVITMTTSHVPKGKVLVLWLSGTAKVLDVRKLGGPGIDAVQPPSNSWDYEFWKLSPN